MRGWAELLLCAAVIVAGWTRTPVGAIVHNGIVWVRGEGQTADVFASFSTALPSRVSDSLVQAITQAGAPQGTPDESALRMAIRAHLGDEALAELEPALTRGDDVAAALELRAVGATQRDRAVRRAAAAGETHPESLEAHRRYLSAEAARQADEGVSEVLALSTVLDLAWPVPIDTRVSSPFGWRDHPTLSKRKFHEGVDLAVPTGTAVHAAGDGRVQRSRRDAVNGNYVTLDHGHGVTTAYCHGEQRRVSRGDQVHRGDLILDSGSTGRSTGPHLHFGLRIDGRPVDPAPFRRVQAVSAEP